MIPADLIVVSHGTDIRAMHVALAVMLILELLQLQLVCVLRVCVRAGMWG